MKGTILAALLLVGLVQNAASLLAQTATAKSISTIKKKKVPIKKKKAPYYKPAPPVDPTEGDNVDGEDLEIRRAAVDALGTMKGSVIVADPNTGRVLTIVNQKLAFEPGFIPCSTIKLVTSIAALNEHVITRDTVVPISRYQRYTLTTAIAQSNNQYFSILGNKLGFDRVTQYARLLGLGEKAGLDIAGEQPGSVAAEPPKTGGVGLMTSFGEGFQMTPLELAGLVSAIANGGTLYYLQCPRTPDEIEHFTAKVKRSLDVSPEQLADLKLGMRGAVDFGTARRANADPTEPIYGKTGTCTDFPTSYHMGWFGSFNEVAHNQVVVVVMLTGTKTFNGPVASGVAGAIYRKLSEQRYFTADYSPRRQSDLPPIVTTYPVAR
jgi:cell division protein FtsI/penicillin-binding protein 2